MAHYQRLVREPSRLGMVLVILLALIYDCQAASCKENEFTCNSSKCVSKDLKCDGEDDCGDFSDEINCTTSGKCNSEEFECSEGSCISSTLVCNGKWECPRGLDEVNCESKTKAPTTSSFEQIGLFQTPDKETKSFPVYEKSQGISIYLRFTAHRCSGHLFEMTSQNTVQFFLLSLTGEGNIEFLFMTSSGPGVIVIPPPPGGSFCNGKRHMLAVQRYLDELRYRVDRGRRVTKKISLLKEPFSRPFRVYVGMSLEGCVSGIDVIIYRTRTDAYPVGVSKGCARTKKTTPFHLNTTASTLNLVAQNLRTKLRKESTVHTSSYTPSTTLTVSKHAVVGNDVTSKDTSTQIDKTVTQHEQVTHSPSVTYPVSTNSAFTKSSTSQGMHAQTSGLVTQSEDVIDPYFVDLNIPTTHFASPAKASLTSGPSRSAHITHSSPSMEPVTVTNKKESTTRNNVISSTIHVSLSSKGTSTTEIYNGEKCEPLRSTFCTYMGYSNTSLPNHVGHKTQLQAEKQMNRLLPFIRANCSSVLKDFICATYLPPCASAQSPAVKPCRELCLRSKRECASLMEAFQFLWPKSFDCQELPSNNKGQCIMAHDAKEEVIPTQAMQFKRRKGCGGILTRSSGTIASPNFPKAYPSDTLCKWVIILPKVYHVIDIILEEVSLEADVNCGYDYLLFLDGLSNQVGPRICGFLPYPRVVTVKGNMASIVFRSDSALNKKGILIKYTAHSYP